MTLTNLQCVRVELDLEFHFCIFENGPIPSRLAYCNYLTQCSEVILFLASCSGIPKLVPNFCFYDGFTNSSFDCKGHLRR